jgi:hypothetical protein
MRKILAVTVAALTITILACSSGGNDQKSSNESDKGSNAGLNQPARDGKFEFTVTAVDCGATTIGTPPLSKSAQGQFCRVTLTVKNIGKEAQTFDGSSQKAFDTSGTKFSNDGEAETYANQGNETFLQQINPGNQVQGVLVFDVPKTTKITRLELHDSAFSGGVKVHIS